MFRCSENVWSYGDIKRPRGPAGKPNTCQETPSETSDYSICGGRHSSGGTQKRHWHVKPL